MYGQISTVAFIGVEARIVEVQVRITPGQAMFAIGGRRQSHGQDAGAGNVAAQYPEHMV